MGFNKSHIIGAALAAAALGGLGGGTLPSAQEMRAQTIEAQKQQPGAPQRAPSSFKFMRQLFGGRGGRKPHRYGGGIPMTAAQQKRASRKRKGIRTHKRRCGMRG